MKIRPVGAELFHGDRRTDMMKLIVAFRSFSNAINDQSVMHKEIIPVCFEIHTKNLNTLCGQNVEFYNFNLQEPCVLYIGRAYRYPPDVAFYIYFFQQI